jgi:aminoglycoside 3-N-acetyltransferase
MEDIRLFRTRDGGWITGSNVLRLLENVRAPEAEVLYMHTGLTFGWPNPDLGRRGLLQYLFELIDSMGVPTLCVPTFTFSFCNGQDYDVHRSSSRMGALNEYIRRLPGAIRSVDPLMSSALIGANPDLVNSVGKSSIGSDSTFDKLHKRGRGVKFLFFGTTVSECFTYTHYVEEQIQVPYRYERKFTGCICSGERSWQDTYTLFVRYRGVVPSSDQKLERALLHQGTLRKESCGESTLSCVDEAVAFETIASQLRADPHCYVADGFADRNEEFAVRDMVAL